MTAKEGPLTNSVQHSEYHISVRCQTESDNNRIQTKQTEPGVKINLSQMVKLTCRKYVLTE